MTDLRTRGLVIQRAGARFIVLLLVAAAIALRPDAGLASSVRAMGNTVVGSDVTGTVSVTVSPSVLSFGSQAVGTKSSPQKVSVAASGPFQMTGSPSLSGANPGDFVLEGGVCGISDPGSITSCTFYVAFAPTAEGPSLATLSISDNAGDSPQTIVLFGLGVRPPATG